MAKGITDSNAGSTYFGVEIGPYLLGLEWDDASSSRRSTFHDPRIDRMMLRRDETR
jgi:hypothetical protein